MSQNYYKGWTILGALFIIYSITNGVILNTLPLFYPELIKEFGWTQDVVTQPAQLLFLVVAIGSPFVGILMDKMSIKNLMYLGAALIMVGFVLYSQIQSSNALLFAYFIFSVGIILAGIIPSMKIITNWFLRNRGLAVGILLVGSSIGGAIFNPVAGKLIAEYGWRNGLIGLGIIAFVMIFVPLLFLVKESPALAGISNAQEFSSSDHTNQSLSELPDVPLKEVLSSRLFYTLLFITGAMWFCIVGIIQHQALFIKDLNTTVDSAKVLSLFFACSVLGKVIFGKLSDHYSKWSIMLLAVCNLALGTFILTMLHHNPKVLLYVYAIVFGIGFSGTFTMIQLLIAEFYQGPSYGKILGLFTMIDTLAGVFGIMTLGKMRTGNGSYDQSFFVLFILSVLAAVVLLLTPKNIKNDQKT